MMRAETAIVLVVWSMVTGGCEGTLGSYASGPDPAIGRDGGRSSQARDASHPEDELDARTPSRDDAATIGTTALRESGVERRARAVV